MKTINRIICSLLLAGACTLGAVAQENQSYFLHTIEKGQSLYSIASMYGVSQADIIKLNPGSDERIFIGRTLRIPRSAANAQKETYHTIASGETLYRLTVKYNVSAKAICDANPGLSAENFRIGQVILIPSTTEAETMAPTETLSNNTVVANNNIPGPIESRCRDMHKVKRKETVFSISREYGISEAELIAANPELKGENKIKKGTFLCIPYPKAQTEQSAQLQATPTNSELFRENRKETERFSTIKAAVILPFLDGVSKSESSRMVEYYEGLLMAVDSLKRTGTSIDLYTYNSGPESASLNSILGKSEMKDMDIIFGPLYQQHIEPLAEFAKKQDTRLVIPFTSKDNTVFQNPAVYQINTPQSYLYSEVYEHFTRKFTTANVIFLDAEDGDKDKVDFIKGLKEELKTKRIPFTELKGENITPESLKGAMNHSMDNVFIPTSGTNVALIKLLPQLIVTSRDNPDYRMQLFGYPEWQTYTNDHLASFYELDTYFYSSFYTNNLFPEAVQFSSAYRKWYSKDMLNSFPKYGMLGFDTGYFFLKGLSQYGNKLEDKLDKVAVTPIQTGFKFERVNNWGGFINRKVFFVHFTKDFELIKLDFE